MRRANPFVPNGLHPTEGWERPLNYPLAPLIDQFLKERTYLKNVTPATLVWYQVAFKNYRATIAGRRPAPTDEGHAAAVRHQATLPASPDGGLEREPSEGVDARRQLDLPPGRTS